MKDDNTIELIKDFFFENPIINPSTWYFKVCCGVKADKPCAEWCEYQDPIYIDDFEEYYDQLQSLYRDKNEKDIYSSQCYSCLYVETPFCPSIRERIDQYFYEDDVEISSIPRISVCNLYVKPDY